MGARLVLAVLMGILVGDCGAQSKEVQLQPLNDPILASVLELVEWKPRYVTEDGVERDAAAYMVGNYLLCKCILQRPRNLCFFVILEADAVAPGELRTAPMSLGESVYRIARYYNEQHRVGAALFFTHCALTLRPEMKEYREEYHKLLVELKYVDGDKAVER